MDTVSGTRFDSSTTSSPESKEKNGDSGISASNPNHVAIDIHNDLRENNDSTPSKRQRTRQLSQSTSHKEEYPARTFGIAKYETPSYTGDRNYDYEKKYPPDKPGQEAGSDARVWKVYLDEAESYDDDMIRGFRDTLDSLLVFAALFSGVVTAFVTEASQNLAPDYAEISVFLLAEQIQLLRAISNGTSVNQVPSSPLGAASQTYGQTDVIINNLFYTSLALSLATALISILVKQWIQAYTSIVSGTAEDRALVRQFRFDGLIRWRLPEIVGVLPLLLHASLALFLIGLCLFVSDLYTSLVWSIGSITVISFAFYSATLLLSAFWIDCPYRVPLLFVPMQYLVYPVVHLHHIMLSVYIPLRNTLMKWKLGYLDMPRVWYAPAERPSLPAESLKAAELMKIKRPPRNSEIFVNALIWLHDVSSNTSASRVSAQALGGSLSNDTDPTSRAFEHAMALVADSHVEWTIWTALANLESDIPSSLDVSTLKQPNPWIRAAERLFYFGQIDTAYRSIVLDRIQAAILAASHEGQRNLVDLLMFWNTELASTALTKSSQRHADNPIHVAADSNDVDLVKMLLDRGTDINVLDPRQETALHRASEKGSWNVVTLLVERGADVNAKGLRGTALQAVSRQGQLGIVKLLVEKGADVNAPGALHGDALQAASEGGRLEVVKVLIANDADVNGVGGGNHGNALQAASTIGRLDIVQVLVQSGAKIDTPGLYYGNSLQAASAKGHLDIVQFLVAQDSSFSPKSSSCTNAMQVASEEGHLDVVKFFIEKGADVNAPSGRFGKALQAAVWRSRLEMVKFLVGQGADVNARDEKHGTPLDAAYDITYPNKRPIIDFLIQHGAVDPPHS